jgi:hypothetical protein
MYIKKSIILLLFITIGCSEPHHGDVSEKEKYQMMEDYVLYESLFLAFGKDSIFNRDGSWGVYFDLAGTEIIALSDYLNSVAQARADSLKPIEIFDYEGKKAIFMNLINMYNYPKEKKILRKVIKERVERLYKEWESEKAPKYMEANDTANTKTE